MKGAVLAVTGCRQFDDVEWFNEVFKEYLERLDALDIKIESVYVGDANGIDAMTYDYCIDNNIKVHCKEADWDKHGKPAGMIRNAEVINPASHVLAFWDGSSYGTKGAIDIALRTRKKLARKKIETTERRYYSRYFKKGQTNGKS